MPSSIGVALTDALDDLISSNQIEPQLAMKIIAHFDKAFIDTLSDRVKSRLSFKVTSTDLKYEGFTSDTPIGSSGYLPFLRRCLDLFCQGCQLQARQSNHNPIWQGQDCELHKQEAW